MGDAIIGLMKLGRIARAVVVETAAVGFLLWLALGGAPLSDVSAEKAVANSSQIQSDTHRGESPQTRSSVEARRADYVAHRLEVAGHLLANAVSDHFTQLTGLDLAMSE